MTFMTSYKRPVLKAPDEESAYLFAAMGTPGGDVFYVNGSNFGPNVTANVIEVTYFNPELSNLAGAVHSAVSCSMVVAHTMLRCRTAPGVGYNFTLTVLLGHQTQDLVLSSVIRLSYHLPVLVQWAPPHNERSLRTRGDEYVYLSLIHI